MDIARELAAKRPEIEVVFQKQPEWPWARFPQRFQHSSTGHRFRYHHRYRSQGSAEEIDRLFRVAIEWKSTLSQTVNWMMQLLMGLRVQDLTSGFRVYRADAGRLIHIENAGFAILPEMLIDAAARGLKVVEEPIRFVFREEGEPKMYIFSTSVSYLRLFAKRTLATRRQICSGA